MKTKTKVKTVAAKKKMTVVEVGRLGGSKGGKARVPKGFAVNRKAMRKAHATQKKKRAEARKAEIEQAAGDTKRRLALILSGALLEARGDVAQVADALLSAIRQKRVCHLTFKAADMFETTSALIGKVTEVENGWEVAFAPDCTTWVTVRRDEHDEPKVGDSITVTVPKVVAIHSQPNPKVLPLAGLAASREQPVVGGLN